MIKPKPYRRWLRSFPCQIGRSAVHEVLIERHGNMIVLRVGRQDHTQMYQSFAFPAHPRNVDMLCDALQIAVGGPLGELLAQVEQSTTVVENWP